MRIMTQEEQDQKRFYQGMYFAGFCFILAGFWLTSFAIITLIHLWKIWV